MTEDTRKERGLCELYAEDPERADALVFGRVAHPDRRGFLKGAGLAAMAAVVGAQIPFHRNYPSGLIPSALRHHRRARPRGQGRTRGAGGPPAQRRDSPNQYESKGFCLYLVDGSGNQELLWRDPDFSCHQPVPLRPRRAPAALPRLCDPPPADAPPLSPVGFRLSGAEGRCELSEVTYGLDPLPAGVKPAWLRISENLPLPYFTQAGQSLYNYLDYVNWTPKRIVGDVPIRPDGGVSFTVPPTDPCTSSCWRSRAVKSGACVPG